MHAADLLSKRAELTPHRQALYEVATDRRYSYQELNERANRSVHFLRQQYGLEKGDRICLLAYNSVVYVDMFYGLCKMGAVLTPLNWRLTTAELGYILTDCQPKLLIYGPEFAHAAAEMSGLVTSINLDEYERGLSTVTDDEPKRPLLTPDDPACILYTSGTTGRPKGAIIPHRQILWNCINTVISWGLTAEDISPIFTPMFHSGGLFVFLTPLFYVGGRIVMTRIFDAAESLRLIEQEQCTVVLGVPTLYQMWLHTLQEKPVHFSHIRWFISGGAPCPPALIQAWVQATGRVLRQGYGLTEVGPNCFSMTDEEAILKAGSVGRPIFHSQMRLVDEQGNDVPAGQTGELLIAGLHVCVGYWNRREATAVSLRDGWFYTGDMARQDEEGYFYIVGRFKDMIISGGENVYAAEVEAVFLQHTAVAETALIGRPDEKWGEVGVMIVVLKTGQTATETDLRDFCRQQLAAYKVPKQVIFADTLPYSPYGKVMKTELKEKYAVPDTRYSIPPDP